ncbi:MAG: 5-amino-6-(5-phosphoribosylamino)uracil reductase [Hadesarchaea archaeon DG-33-1]|nr:MAG: 5-amino-6-(5-phosphoribosylamino)uracil reductase [Hadesarchaea archaeon DG-33-1]
MDRPYVILNAAMTLDGKIATVTGDSSISCEKDLDRIHRLRASVDAVMVGVGTVLADDPSLTVRRARGRNPLRLVVDSFGKTPRDAKVLNGSARTVIAVTARASKRNLERLRAKGAQIIAVGRKEVDLQKLSRKLYALGVRKLLLEGGSTLNWGMLKQGLVDEVRVAVAPYIAGGAKARTLVGGRGFAKIAGGIALELVSIDRVGKDLLLTYRVRGAGVAPKAG